MVNYYDILGLPTTAGITEIKAAFRHLAKLYHPDINPQGKEQFSKILKAYETLSDSRLKLVYDQKLNSPYSQRAEKEKTKPGAKNWRFDERELKRRQYYNEHIKQYEKKTTKQSSAVEQKANYNEFKYILFATPLAVILFLGIMSVTSPRKSNHNTSSDQKVENTAFLKTTSDLKLGDAPYTDYFGTELYDTSQKQTLRIKNLTGLDVVVCLFKETVFVRNFFIANNYSAEVSQLPPEALTLNYSSGLYFDSSRKLNKGTLSGSFTRNSRFYKSNRPIAFSSINELTLLPGVNQGFSPVNEFEFFRK
ncbi:MAG: J domain-containing protein [bacterium]|nr:J domain-containing protein [bacterium]